MFKLHPIALVLSAGLLQACATPPAPPAITMQPVLQVRNSADQTAATYFRLGKYHQERGETDLARTAYTESIALDGRQLEPRNALAAIHFQQGRFDEAKSLLLQLVTEFPSVAHPYNNLGYIQYMQGDYVAATNTLQRALALDAKNERARNNLDAARVAVASRREATPVASIPTNRTPESNAANLEKVKLPVAADVNPATDTKNAVMAEMQSSSTPAPLVVAPSRMELVAVAPNVYDLRLKSATTLSIPAPASRLELVALAPDVYELKLKSTPVIASAPANEAPEKPILASVPPLVSKVARLEVANGNGVEGMAKRIGSTLGQQGIAVSRLTNDRPYTQQATKIQYRAGYEQAAQTLKRALKGHAVLVEASDLSANTDMRLVLGKDVISQMAQIENRSSQAKVATNSQAGTATY